MLGTKILFSGGKKQYYKTRIILLNKNLTSRMFVALAKNVCL